MSDVRALASWCGALAGLLAILIGGLVPAALFLPAPEPILLPLPVTWQVPALLLCAMVSGPRAGVMAAVGYLTLGLFSLPVFHGGGGLNYVLEPGFGYLAGFVPAAWLTGRLAQQDGMASVRQPAKRQRPPKDCCVASRPLIDGIPPRHQIRHRRTGRQRCRP